MMGELSHGGVEGEYFRELELLATFCGSCRWAKACPQQAGPVPYSVGCVPPDVKAGEAPAVRTMPRICQALRDVACSGLGHRPFVLRRAGMPVLLKANSFYGFGWLAKKASIVSVALICGVRRSPGQEWWPPWMA